MKKINLYILGCVALSLLGCSTKEGGYNTAKYILNKECKTSEHCSGGITRSYQEHEQERGAYQKTFDKDEEQARLKKIQEEAEPKK